MEAILYPVVALVALTFVVMVRMYRVRVGAARAGRVRVRDFKLGESPDVPADVALPNRNFMNLLEVPVLFYVACIVFYVTATVDVFALILAWLYVAARVAHSVVHLTYNNVLHRLTAFGASNIALLALWAVLAVRLF